MRLKVPHTYALLAILIVAAAACTWIVPAGVYDRVSAGGRELIDPASYHRVPASPAGPVDVFLAYPKGLSEVADIVFYIFILGGAFGVLNATGTITGSIGRLVQRMRGRGALIVPVLTLIFAIGGGTIGIAEETLVFLPALLLLARSMGYDSLVAGAIALVGANAGFAAAFTNPFTVGVAQGIVGLPLFSGIGFRFVSWTVITAATIAWVAWYAERVRQDPTSSLVFEIDRQRPPVAAEEAAQAFGPRHAGVLVLSALALGALAVGSARWHWSLPELSALFLALAAIAGPVGGLSLDETAASFVKGAADLTYAALVVGLARGVLVILRDANTLDTITRAMATAVQQWPPSLSVLGIYVMQTALNFIVPSGAGQAAISMPIVAPLGDVLGITRQTNVLAYQFGNGFTNIVTPTQGYFMAALGILGIPWSTWVRWLLPLLGIWLLISGVALLVAQAMHWGPF
jgi:uncharacterized ion transporter superfamily protein YfcC